MGVDALFDNVANSGSTAIGYFAMRYANNSSTGSTTYNTAVGNGALMGSSTPANNTGKYNSALGSSALVSNSGGGDNTAMGAYVMFNNGAGSENTALGSWALYSNQGNSRSTAIGYRAMYYAYDRNPSGYYTYNTAVGVEALLGSSTAANNVGTENTAIGDRSLYVVTSGSGNTAIGRQSGYGNATGSYNTFVGYAAGLNAANFSNTTALGNGANCNSSNNMAFGNTSVTTWMFGRASLSGGAAFQVGTGASNGNGAYLTTGGAWTNTSDVNLKSDITAIEGSDLLARVMQLDITRWKYTGTEEYHIGPMAQQFHSLFQTGVNNTSISTIDPAGVALKAIQEQQKTIAAQQAKLEAQEQTIAAMQAAIKQLQAKAQR